LYIAIDTYNFRPNKPKMSVIAKADILIVGGVVIQLGANGYYSL